MTNTCKHETLFLTIEAVAYADKPRSDGSCHLGIAHDLHEASVKHAQCTECHEQVSLPEVAPSDTDSVSEWLGAFYA